MLRVWLVGPDGAKMPSNPYHEARCVMRTLHRPLPDVRPHGGSEKPAEFPKATRLAGGRARGRPRTQGMERTRALQSDPWVQIPALPLSADDFGPVTHPDLSVFS